MKKALITGGCGFVGRHFTKYLVDHGWDVLLVDDLSVGLPLDKWPEFVRPKGDFRFLKMDARDFFTSCDEDFDFIVHLAAVVGGRLTIEGDPLRVATDLAIDALFFNWLTKMKNPPKKNVYFSSSAAYPNREQSREYSQRLHEGLIDFNKDIGVPDMTYGWAKLTGEFLVQQAVEKYGLDVVIYRPFSGYGEDQDFTYPFPSITRRAVNRKNPFVVWGSGEQTRDFIHLDDVVEAVMETMWKMSPGEALNLGWGRSTGFKDLARIACEAAGYEAEIINDPTKPEGVFARVCDPSRFFELYKPKITLEEGIRRAYAYQMDLKSRGLLPEE